MGDLDPPSERALKYGRNTLVLSCVMLVLAWVPGINIDSFKPFGFEFGPNGQFWTWCILEVVLVYYLTNFFVQNYADVVSKRHRHSVDLATARMRPDEKRLYQLKEIDIGALQLRHYLDFWLPTLLGSVALVAGAVVTASL